LKSFTTPRKLLTEIDRLLSVRPNPRKSALDGVLDALYKGRHYFWIGIYLRGGDRLERHASRGPEACCRSFALNEGNVGTTGASGVTKIIPDVSGDHTYKKCFDAVKSELVVPVKIGVHVSGVIDVESDRLNAFGSKDRVLIEAVARKAARYLEGSGRYLLRRAREAAQPQNARSAGA
jgi:putative methionine-R-sulfoxide reductase with GAF domain